MCNISAAAEPAVCRRKIANCSAAKPVAQYVFVIASALPPACSDHFMQATFAGACK